MTTTLYDCPACGYSTCDRRCGYCHGSVRRLDGRGVIELGRRPGPLDVCRGIGEVRRAFFVMLHGKEFIGLLRLPMVMNALAFLLVAVGGWLVLAPLCASAFSTPWWLFDGVRQHYSEVGAHLWLLTCWLLLGPPLLDLIAGAAQEPLGEATERRLLGPLKQPFPELGQLRLRERVRVFAWLLLAVVPCLGLVLVPWIGLPLVVLLGAVGNAIVWFEPPMARRQINLRRRLDELRRHRWRALGVGIGVHCLALVPFANLLGLAPIATIAATASYLQFDRRSITAAA